MKAYDTLLACASILQSAVQQEAMYDPQCSMSLNEVIGACKRTKGSDC